MGVVQGLGGLNAGNDLVSEAPHVGPLALRPHANAELRMFRRPEMGDNICDVEHFKSMFFLAHSAKGFADLQNLYNHAEILLYPPRQPDLCDMSLS